MKITVIIPVYNAEKYICRCIDSILNQTYPDWEIIAVNDGSSDSSLEILNRYANKDSRVKIYSQNNKGAGAARNLAINNIDYDDGYVVFVDSDDKIEPDYFESLAKHDEDVVLIDVIQREDETNKVLRYERMSKYKNAGKEEFIKKQMTGYIPWGGVRKATKANLLSNNSIRYSNHKIGEESIFSFKVLFFANSVGFLCKDVYSYFIHKDSLSASKVDDPWGGVVENLKTEIISMNSYEKYAASLNAFYISAAAVSIRRMASTLKYKEFKKQAKRKMTYLNSVLDSSYEIDKNSMRKMTKVLYFLLKLKMYFFIYVGNMFYR